MHDERCRKRLLLEPRGKRNESTPSMVSARSEIETSRVKDGGMCSQAHHLKHPLKFDWNPTGPCRSMRSGNCTEVMLPVLQLQLNYLTAYVTVFCKIVLQLHIAPFDFLHRKLPECLIDAVLLLTEQCLPCEISSKCPPKRVKIRPEPTKSPL